MHDVRQTTSDVFLVRPASFGANPQTVSSNAFQQPTNDDPTEIQFTALAEFDQMVAHLRSAGVNAIVFDDTHQPPKPDAIFPNNWISTDADGKVMLYPMQAENRRFERRDDIVERLSAEHGFHISAITDLSDLERSGNYLESTGSMVLDRVNHVAYAGLSDRTDPVALAEFAQLANYEIIAFTTAGADGRPMYHTNVMISIGAGFAVVCAETIVDAEKRHAVLQRLAESGRQVIEISLSQAENFSGNMIELATQAGNSLIVMSRRAHDSLSAQQLTVLERHGHTLALPIDTIETIGGGSVRCMIAEIFLPPSAKD